MSPFTYCRAAPKQVTINIKLKNPYSRISPLKLINHGFAHKCKTIKNGMVIFSKLRRDKITTTTLRPKLILFFQNTRIGSPIPLYYREK